MTNESVVEPQTTTNLPISRFSAKLCYLLFTTGWLFPPLLLIALIINLLRRRHARGTWLESHFTYQVNTLFIAAGGYILLIAGIFATQSFILFYILGHINESAPTAPEQGLAFIGLATLAIVFWYLYRMIKGWSALGNDMPV